MPDVPHSVAIIMDGNRRWAKKAGKLRALGHEAGAVKIKEVASWAREVGVKFLTLYAFSSENWAREQDELESLIDLLERYLDSGIEDLLTSGVRLRIIGDLSIYSQKLQEKLRQREEQTSKFLDFTIVVALNYGGKAEILRAAHAIVQKKAEFTAENFARELYTAGLPDPDLLIRTGGSRRLSNFLLWQAAYTEFYFTDVLWPDFAKSDFLDAINFFKNEKRNFGK